MPTFPQYQFLADWSRNGTFGEVGEDVTARVVDDPGFRCERGRDQLRALAPPMAGASAMTLYNRSRDYSPENAASPLAGLLGPGCAVSARATWLATTYHLATTVLDDLPQATTYGRPTVDTPALGALSRLAGQPLSTALYTNIRTDEAIAILLDAAGWPAGDRVLSTGRTTLRYWWMDDADALAMLLTLFRTEGPGAALYEDGRGRLVFEDRHYRLLTTRATTSQATFRDSGAAPWHAEPFGYNPGLKDVINAATLEVNRRTVGGTEPIWNAGGDIALGPGESLTIRVVSSDGEPFIEAFTPQVGPDFTVTYGGLASIDLPVPSGASSALTIVAGAGGATLANLQVRGKRLAKQTVRVSNTVDAAASIARHKRRPYDQGVWPEIDINVARDFCNAIVGAYKDPRPTVSITVEGADDTQLAQILGREISDRVRVVEAMSGLDTEMHIERIGHAVTWGGRKHTATFGCSKVVGGGLFLLDSATLGKLDTNTLAF